MVIPYFFGQNKSPSRGGTPPLHFPSLFSIVVFTQHLAVGRVGFPALVPGLDVVAFHFRPIWNFFLHEALQEQEPQLFLDVRKLRVKLVLVRRPRGVHASIQLLVWWRSRGFLVFGAHTVKLAHNRHIINRRYMLKQVGGCSLSGGTAAAKILLEASPFGRGCREPNPSRFLPCGLPS
jgi:hypothetical protein